MKLTLSAILAFLILVPTAWAQEAKIQFPPGSFPATLKARVNPLSGKEYELRVSPNQRVEIHLTSTSRKKLVRFDLKRDRYLAKSLAGGASTTDWEGVLKEGGSYWISVFALRDAGDENFTLVISEPQETLSDSSKGLTGSAIDADKVPTSGAKREDFIPAGWKIARHVEGDLNRDGRPDQVLQLVTADTPEDPSDTDAAPEAHALLILFADGGKFRRTGMASKLLIPTVPPVWSRS